MRVAAASLLAAAALTACTGRPRQAAEGALPEWAISAEPQVVIGREGDPRYEFFRVTGVATLGDGRIVVADGGAQEIRLYDASGEFLRAFGGSGEGPGEFRALTGVAVRRDSILATESFPGPSRVHVFDAEGSFVRVTRLNPDDTPGGVAPRAMLSPTAVVVEPGRGFRRLTLPPANAVTRDSVTLGLMQLTGPQVVHWLGTFPATSFYSYALPPGGRVERTAGTYTLGPSLAVGASSDRAWIGDASTGNISVFDVSGALVARVEFPLPPRAFDEDALEAARAAALARVAGADAVAEQTGRAMVEGLYREELRPVTAPRFARFTGGLDGEMWAECFTELPTAAHCAVIFDRAGVAVARATIPADLELRAVDRDRVMGVRRDAAGVERVVVYRLAR